MHDDSLEDWAFQILGLQPSAAHTEVVSCWSSSHVIGIEASRRKYFAKKCGHSNSGEVLRAAEIAQLLPKAVPKIVAQDTVHARMITLGSGAPLAQGADKEVWKNAAANWTGIQLKLIPLLPHFTSWVDCREKTDPSLLFLDEKLLRLTSIAVRQLLTELSNQVRALHRFRIPNSVVHGDLSSGNILVSNGSFKFIDWSESFIGNPILDAIYFVVSNRGYFKSLDVSSEEILDCMVSPWHDHASVHELALCASSIASQTVELLNFVEQNASLSQYQSVGKLELRHQPLLLSLYLNLLALK